MIKFFFRIDNVIITIAILIAAFAFAFPEYWIIQRLNQSSTILLALLTAAYVYFTYKILDSTRPQPHVFVSLPSEELNIYLSINNVGSSPAYDVEVTIDPSLDLIAPTDAFKGASKPMLKQSFLPPETEIKNFVSSTLQILNNKGGTTIFKVGIKYRDYNYRHYSDAYEIDVASYVYEKRFLNYDVKHYLNEISNTLKEMKDNVEQINRKEDSKTRIYKRVKKVK